MFGGNDLLKNKIKQEKKIFRLSEFFKDGKSDEKQIGGGDNSEIMKMSWGNMRLRKFATSGVEIEHVRNAT